MKRVNCPKCKGAGGFKMTGMCFACDYAAHPEGDSCDWRSCHFCKGKGKVFEYIERIKKYKPLPS